MADLTPRLGIKKPIGTENVTRATFNENYDIIDAGAAKKADVDAHVAASTGVHGATSAATAIAIMQRDASGRAKVAAPSAGDDIARKDTVDAVAVVANAALPATSYTAADVLTKIKTVDGSGSGLDADTVKGYTPVNKTGDTMTGTLTTPYLYVNPQDSVNEGGEITLKGAGINPDVILDNLAGKFRIAGNQAWDTGSLRDNGGVLELFTGGTWKAVGGVKNVQRGNFTLPTDGTTTLNITIASVNMAKAFVLVNFVYENASSEATRSVRYRLTSATNLELWRGSGMYESIDGSYEIVESY